MTDMELLDILGGVKGKYILILFLNKTFQIIAVI